MILVTDGEPDKGYGPCDDGDKTLGRKLRKNNIKFGVLAIDGVNKKDFRGRLGCLVDDPERDIVIMNNFYSFYEYRDPTGGDLCVDPGYFTPPDPTVAPSVSPSFTPTSQPTKGPSGAPTESPSGFPSRSPTDLPTNLPTQTQSP